MTRYLVAVAAAVLALASPAAASTRSVKKDARAIAKVVHTYAAAIDAHGAEIDAAADGTRKDMDGCQSDLTAAQASADGKAAIAIIHLTDYVERILAIIAPDVEAGDAKLAKLRVHDRDIKAYRRAMVGEGKTDLAHLMQIDACAVLREWAGKGYDEKQAPSALTAIDVTYPKRSAKGARKLKRSLSKSAFNEVKLYDGSVALNRRVEAFLKAEFGV